jgi:16S rRNA (cytidine1402-2'-O)-methyltransferase
VKPPGTGLDDPDQNGAQPLSDGSVDIASQPSGSDLPCKPEAVENAYIGRKNRLIPGLHVVATPIGNLSDITDRARQTLAGAAVIACEDTRVTGLLLRHLGLSVPMLPYHEHNADRVRPQLMARLAAGEVVALVSDAGTPLISDPGFKLVREVRAAGHAVVPVPGASALLSALVSAGLPTDRFMFAGFLSQKSKARRDTLDELKAVPATLIFYESTRRLPESLADMAATLGAGREAAVCRELTKLHEEVRTGTLESLAAHYADQGPPKGEAVVVIGPPLAAPPPDADDLDSALRAAFAEGLSVRDATAAVVASTGLKKKQVYSRALELHDEDQE